MTIKMQNGERVYNDYFNSVALANYAGWSSGAAVTQSVIPAMSVDVSAGKGKIGTTNVTIGAQTVTITAADPSDDRMDLILCDNTGTCTALAGTPSSAPRPSDSWDPTTHFVLARVRVQSGATMILNADIKDMRLPVGGAGGGGTGSIIPDTDAAYDLGSNSNRWNDAWFAGTVTVGTLDINGGLELGNDILPDTNNAYNLGSSSFKFKDGYFAGKLTVDDDVIAGGDIVAGTLGSVFLGVLVSDPGTPVTGQIWFNSTDGQFKGYNGTSIIILG